MRVAACVLASILIAGCTPGFNQQSAASPSPKTTSSPTSSPASTALGVAVEGVLASGLLAQYRVSLFDTNATLLHQVTAHIRSIDPKTTALPETSTTSTKVFYLDGDFSIRSLSRDGTSALVTTIPPFAATGIGAVQDVEAAFAVSPDEKRIAVAIVSYAATILYVEDLSNGNRADIYNGPIIEWPVGWWRGQLVLQLGDLSAGGYGSKHGYHVVSATTGTRSASVCGTGTTWGVPTLAGTLCQKDGGLFRLAWDASGPAVTGYCEQHGPYGAALKPDGLAWATSVCGSNGSALQFYSSDGAGAGMGSNSVKLPLGWLDQYLVVNEDNQIRLYLTSGYSSPGLGDHAIFVGTVPTELS